MDEGVDGLLRDKTRPPGKTPLAPEPVAKIVGLTHTPPPHAATHWTLRAMAKAVGVAASTVLGGLEGAWPDAAPLAAVQAFE